VGETLLSIVFTLSLISKLMTLPVLPDVGNSEYDIIELLGLFQNGKNIASLVVVKITGLTTLNGTLVSSNFISLTNSILPFAYVERST
jgi:hypothetical protein